MKFENFISACGYVSLIVAVGIISYDRGKEHQARKDKNAQAEEKRRIRSEINTMGSKLNTFKKDVSWLKSFPKNDILTVSLDNSPNDKAGLCVSRHTSSGKDSECEVLQIFHGYTALRIYEQLTR